MVKKVSMNMKQTGCVCAILLVIVALMVYAIFFKKEKFTESGVLDTSGMGGMIKDSIKLKSEYAYYLTQPQRILIRALNNWDKTRQYYLNAKSKGNLANWFRQFSNLEEEHRNAKFVIRRTHMVQRRARKLKKAGQVQSGDFNDVILSRPVLRVLNFLKTFVKHLETDYSDVVSEKHLERHGLKTSRGGVSTGHVADGYKPSVGKMNSYMAAGKYVDEAGTRQFSSINRGTAAVPDNMSPESRSSYGSEDSPYYDGEKHYDNLSGPL